jgi:uncharacterized protein
VTLPSKRHVLIAAVSGRALAQAARDSGYIPLVADFFGDADTRAIADAVEAVGGGFEEGFTREALEAALGRLAKGREPIGLVYGAGFESDPTILAGHRLVGNDPDTVARLKSPLAFAADCARLGIPHPAVSGTPPGASEGWLSKKAGASGGSHIKQGAATAAPGRYYQRFVDGMPVSALFAADGARAQILGFSRQWCAPTPDLPYRYGGAVQPSGLPESRLAPLADAAAKLARDFELRGLNSADFIVSDGQWWLLEVNPRPGATLDVFRRAIPDIFERHVAGCEGRLLDEPAIPLRHFAEAVVYARTAIARIPIVSWPDWAADRQTAGTRVEKGAPLCSVAAEGETAVDAIAGTAARAHIVTVQLERKAA